MSTMVACIDAAGGLGFEGKLPWNVPTELAHFKSVTMGRTLGVGSGTKLPPLLGRKVITFSKGKQTLNRFLALEKSGIIIGGATIFEQCLGRVDTIILSVLPDTYTCDCFFNMARLDRLYKIRSVDHRPDFKIITLGLR